MKESLGPGVLERAFDAASILQACRFHFEQDSVQVLGIQAADLVAHTCGTMLFAQLGVVKKMVKSGENSGYDPDSDVELEFKLWAGLRYNFFAAAPPPVSTWESQLDFQVDVKSRGLHIADTREEKGQNGALVRFGPMYLGCIHWRVQETQTLSLGTKDQGFLLPPRTRTI